MLISSPSTRVLTVTVYIGVTEPKPLKYTGMLPLRARVAVTLADAPPAPPLPPLPDFEAGLDVEFPGLGRSR